MHHVVEDRIAEEDRITGLARDESDRVVGLAHLCFSHLHTATYAGVRPGIAATARPGRARSIPSRKTSSKIKTSSPIEHDNGHAARPESRVM